MDVSAPAHTPTSWVGCAKELLMYIGAGAIVLIIILAIVFL